MSFSILRTNTGLTTNIKIIIDSEYKLYLESIDSAPELSSSRYKKVNFNKDNYYEDLIPFFYKNTPSDLSFGIKYDNDNKNMANDFSKQYDDIYQMGPRNIIDNKNYIEEFECFSPLYIDKGNIPKGFIIFRIDGPGIINLTKDNFNDEIIKKFKCIKFFDLTKSTPIGEWLDNNFNKNDSYPATPFEIDFRKLEFSKWNGIDYETGGYTYKSFFLDETLESENPINDLEKFVFDGYKNNKVVFPNIINLSFLFDDTPATPSSLKKWSLNRYFGFYIDDIECIDMITPYIPVKLRSDVIISDGNVLTSLSSNSPFENLNIISEFSEKPYYIEYLGKFYKIEQFTEESGITLTPNSTSSNLLVDGFTNPIITKYRIISDIDLAGKELFLNKKSFFINSNGYIINYYDFTNYIISDFDSADIWLIEINGKLNTLVKDTNGLIKVNSDYGFDFKLDKYDYWINDPDPLYRTSVSLIVDFNNPPKSFKIYRINFTDIKDFDTSIIDTEYSKYEYEKNDTLTETDETKMYLTDLRSTTNPKNLDDYIYNDEVVNIPCSSEYTTGLETFRIEDNDLSNIWRKNSIYCRWIYQNSISSNDYPYLMNNNLDIFESYNKTCNPFDMDAKRIERNLDYFYTINSSTSSYIHHSLHIENHNGTDIDTTFRFELDKYLNLGTYSTGTMSATYSYDYFSYFFSKKTLFDTGNIIKNSNKYSVFNIGDNIIPNTTLFRGLKFKIHNVDSIKSVNGNVENINLKNINTFNGYKFSILLSDNEFSISGNGITSSTNNMQWDIIENWKMDKEYSSGEIIIFNDILYQSLNTNTITNPTIKPYNSSDWSIYSNIYSPFWIPTNTYSNGDFIYNNGEYYQYDISGSEDFWYPSFTYSIGDVVLYKGKYWYSNKNINTSAPGSFILSSGITDWSVTQSTSPLWNLIELWNPNTPYIISNKVIYNYVIYESNIPSSGEQPDINTSWDRVYSILMDTNYVYTPTSNPIIEMNNRYYLINSNSSNSTLENGINIYINKKWKNILINININDNTIKNLSETDRDDLYNELNSKLTSFNFTNCINDISNKFGFSDYLNYIIIDNDGSISKYNINNISSLPYLIICESPDEFEIKVDSISYTSKDLSKNIYKPKKSLSNGKINNVGEINYYNNLILAYEITKNNNDRKIIDISHGLQNINSHYIYRHSGYYMPLFYDIDLFKRPGLTSSLIGNYKFDTTLTKFGIIKQRIISKVNRTGNILKLKNNKSSNSIYPMIDEFGYTFIDFFIFKSTWDKEYHIECIENK